MSSLNIDIIVPCRIGSRRLPGKPLIRVNEKEIILWVLDKLEIVASKYKAKVILATDSWEIHNLCNGYKGFVVAEMTKDHEGGLDRAYECFKKSNGDLCLVVQGDEPNLSPDEIVGLIESSISTYKNEDSFISTFYSKKGKNKCPVYIAEVNNEIVYMSRQAIPGALMKSSLKSTLVYIYLQRNHSRHTQRVQTNFTNQKTLNC